MIGYLIKQILLRTEKSGCLAKSIIELDEHDIDYQPCTNINAQAVADFVVEIPDTLKSKPTIMPIDHSEHKRVGTSGNYTFMELQERRGREQV